MGYLNDSKKRDFVTQLIVIIKQNTQLLIDKGLDPDSKVVELEAEIKTADEAEGKQTESKVAAKNATALAKQTLKTAYTKSSSTVELISGALGKNHNLVKEIRKLRK